MDMMKREVEKNLLKYAAGHSIFCNGCNRVLDWKSTAIIDAIQNGKAVSSVTCCTKCLDARYGALHQAIDEVNKLDGKDIILEVTRWSN
jgi:hypothetical protein